MHDRPAVFPLGVANPLLGLLYHKSNLNCANFHDIRFCLPKRVTLKSYDAITPGFCLSNQACALQNAQMLRRRLQRNRKWVAKFADGGGALRKPLQDGPSGGIGEGVEGGVDIEHKSKPNG